MFPDRMLSLMKLKKITKKQMSEDCKFGINQIKYWQTCHNTPDAVTMAKIADRLETTTMYLLEFTDDPDPIALIDPSKKEPPMLEQLNNIMKDMTEEELEELNRYVDYMVNRKNN